MKEETLKNVVEPVKIYKVDCDKPIEGKMPEEDISPQKSRSKSVYYILSAVVMVLVAIILIWQFIPVKQTVDLEKSIAILPIKDLSEDQNNQ